LHETEPPTASLTLTIDLAALARNWRALAAAAGTAECAAVVKADAYGIGIERAAPTLAAAGARTFFVALPAEGVRMRASLVDTAARAADIYVLGGFLPEWADAFRGGKLRPVLNTVESAGSWARCFPGAPSALHVDTGMNRLGLAIGEALEVGGDPALVEAAAPRLLVSHLACADEPAHPMNRAQLERFGEVRAAFAHIPASLANSAGILLGPAYHFDMVRAGVALYGGRSAPDSDSEVVVTAEARILQVRSAARGETVGYGAAHRLARDSRLAVLAAGYADGYIRAAGISAPRPPSCVVIAGWRAPLVGRVSMDLMAADVTDIPEQALAASTHAELFGPNLPIDEVAAARGTIAYELLTALSRRAERRYLGAESG
jgi:alanine racemase